MANLKEIRKRIQSVKNTQQITSAMKMVAAAKLKKAQERIEKARPYAEKMGDVLASLALRTHEKAHPLLVRREVKNVALVVVSSDRGLCGAFNQNIIKTAEQFIRQNRSRYSEILFTMIGKKGYDYFKIRPITIQREYLNITGKLSYELAQSIADNLRELFLSANVDEVYILYNRFKTTISQELVFTRILPISPAGSGRRPDACPGTSLSRPMRTSWRISSGRTSRCRSSGRCWNPRRPSLGRG